MDDPSQQAADLICEVLKVAFDALETFEREADQRGASVPQILAAAIAHGLGESGLLRAPAAVN